jgi:hypothetical protein
VNDRLDFFTGSAIPTRGFAPDSSFRLVICIGNPDWADTASRVLQSTKFFIWQVKHRDSNDLAVCTRTEGAGSRCRLINSNVCFPQNNLYEGMRCAYWFARELLRLGWVSDGNFS